MSGDVVHIDIKAVDGERYAAGNMRYEVGHLKLVWRNGLWYSRQEMTANADQQCANYLKVLIP